MEQPGGAGSYATILNIVKGMTGSAMVTLPMCFALGGFALTSFVFICSVACYCFAFWILGECCRLTQIFTYRGLWAKLIGPKTAVTVDFFMCFNGSISCTLYTICFGNYVMKLFRVFLGPENLLGYNSINLY